LRGERWRHTLPAEPVGLDMQPGEDQPAAARRRLCGIGSYDPARRSVSRLVWRQRPDGQPVAERAYRWTGGGWLVLVTNASSCAYGLHGIRP